MDRSPNADDNDVCMDRSHENKLDPVKLGPFAFGERARLRRLANQPVVLYFRQLSGNTTRLAFYGALLHTQIHQLVYFHLRYRLPQPTHGASQLRLLSAGELLNELKTLSEGGILGGDMLDYVWETEPCEVHIVLPNGDAMPFWGRNATIIYDVKVYI